MPYNLVVLVALLLLPLRVSAGTFDNAVGAMRMQATAYDQSAASVRVGVNFTPGVQSKTLFRADASVGGTCGAFNFGASMKEFFEEIPDLLNALAWDVVRSLPMLALCYAEPVVCDIAKDIKNFMNVAIQARFGQCQSMQNAAMFTGLRLRGDAIAECLGEAQQAGWGIERAMQACNTQALRLRLPDGSFGGQMNVIEDSLRTAGASSEVQELARAWVGDINVRGGEPFSMSSTRPLDAMMGAFQGHKDRYATAYERAVDSYRTTRTVAEVDMRAMAIPGAATPPVAVEALAAMKNDPERYQAHVGALSTTAALGRLTWECNDLQAQIEAATQGNPNVSAATLPQIRSRLERLRENLAQVTATVLAAEKHNGNLDKLLFEYTKLINTAAQAGVNAPAVQVTIGRYGTQQPLGYAR